MEKTYRIRESDSDDIRGPFTVGQLSSLVDAHQVSAQTLLQEEGSDQWRSIGQNSELNDTLFPEKKKYTFKPKVRPSHEEGSSNVPEMNLSSILDTVSEEVQHDDKVNSFSLTLQLRTIGAIMLLSAITLLFPYRMSVWAAFQSGQFMWLITQPKFIVGMFDLIVAAMGLFNLGSTYSVVRVRVMIGLGFYAYIHWALGQTLDLYAITAGFLAVFIATLTLNRMIVILCGLVGVLGMGFICLSTLWVS